MQLTKRIKFKTHLVQNGLNRPKLTELERMDQSGPTLTKITQVNQSGPNRTEMDKRIDCGLHKQKSYTNVA